MIYHYQPNPDNDEYECIMKPVKKTNLRSKTVTFRLESDFMPTPPKCPRHHLKGPFYAEQAIECTSLKTHWVVTSQGEAVFSGNFSVLVSCGNDKKAAEFIAWACNNALKP